MPNNKNRYWERRNAGLCVQCCAPANGKSRCPACMKDQAYASKKSSKLRIQRLEARIRELEGAGR